MMVDNNQWHLVKFGGTSVSSRENWDNIVAIIKRKQSKGTRVFVVHSALSTVSNRLESLIDYALQDSPELLESQLSQLLDLHKTLIKSLELPKEMLTDNFSHLKRLLEGVHLLGEASDRIRAQIMAQGELWSTKIGQSYLAVSLSQQVLLLDAREYIKASENQPSEYLSVNCEFTQDQNLIEAIAEHSLVITQGFIGANCDGDTVLLGRGGSDTSAAYFSAKIACSRLEIWTDVPGIFSANPSQLPNARLLKSLNYDEAQEMASAGAKVLHPRAIRPAQKSDIPIYIRSTIEPEIEGTKIHNFNNKMGMVKAITAHQGITLISMESLGMWQQAGFLADLFNLFKKHNISVDLVSTSETNVTVSLDKLNQVVNKKSFTALTQELSQICRVEIIHNCSAVSIVGRNVRAILHKISAAFSIFESYKVYLLSQAASDLNLTFVIDDEHCNKIIATLHEMLITNNPNSQILGPTAKELKEPSENISQPKWWQAKQEEIEAHMQSQDSAYIYNLEVLNRNINNLQSISALDRVFFAVKSNNNPQVLEQTYQQGIGFETVSIFEVQKILQQFPNIERDRILFTPNFAAQKEYLQALQLGICLSLDSGYPLKHWAASFSNKSIFLRVDPNIGKGHHEHVKTAGVTSKFGIPIAELDALLPILQEHNIKVIGLHAHAGSGILSEKHWAEHALLLAQVADKFETVRFLNLGGGFGVKEREQQSELNMQKIDEHLWKVKNQYPQFQLWIEPGRYLVANCGVLVTKVTQVKQKQNYCYVGVSTGMNSLMRPALYGSYHPIVNLSRMMENKTVLATIVGPICESTDKLGIEIPFPITSEGDLVLIENAGAYGRVMANHYNMRAPAEEYCLS